MKNEVIPDFDEEYYQDKSARQEAIELLSDLGLMIDKMFLSECSIKKAQVYIEGLEKIISVRDLKLKRGDKNI